MSRLREELRALECEVGIDEESPLWRNVLGKPLVNPQNHQATFVGRDRFTVVVPREKSFRQQVDNWFKAKGRR